MKSRSRLAHIHDAPLRVSLPRFLMLATSVVLFVGLGALVAAQVTGTMECVDVFLHGSGALFLVTLAFIQFSLSRMVVGQFAGDEPLQPAWFLIMLSSGCHLAGTLCVQILSTQSPLNPLAYSGRALANPADIQRFGLLAGGPLQMLLMAGGLYYVLRLCRRTRIVIRHGWPDAILLLIAVAGAFLQLRTAAGVRSGEALAAYEYLLAAGAPLLILLLIQATILRRYMTALNGGMIAKCWNSFAASIFLAVLANLGLWLAKDGYLPAPLAATTWYISLLSATASAVGPAWQIEAVQSACGEVGVPRFSPVAMSLAALRLLNTSR